MKKMIIKSVLFLILPLFGALAEGMMPSEEHATEFVKKTADRSLEIIHSDKEFEEKKKSLSLVFKEVVDIDWIARFVVAKHWRSISEEDKDIYLNVYRKYLTASYVPLFSKYNGHKYEIAGAKKMKHKQFVVRMLIHDKAAASPIDIDYKVKFRNGSFKIRDIIAEDISMLATQRSEFGSILSNHDIKYLISKLESKIKEMQN